MNTISKNIIDNISDKNNEDDNISIISVSDTEPDSDIDNNSDIENTSDINSDTSRSSSPILDSEQAPLSLSGLSLDDSQKKIINDTLESDSDALSISDCSNFTDNESDYNSEDDELEKVIINENTNFIKCMVFHLTNYLNQIN